MELIRSARQPLGQAHHVSDLERLAHEGREAGATLGHRHLGQGTHHHYRNVTQRRVSGHTVQHTGPIHDRHHLVEEHQVGPFLSQHLKPLLAVCGHQDAVSLVLKNRLDEIGDAEFILDHEHGRHR
jgi:hypothetical protein